MAQDAPLVVDRVVAVVGERLVTASDVALEAVLAEVDVGGLKAIAQGEPDPLQRAIDRAIIRGLAGTTAVYAPSDSDVRARAQALRAEFSSNEGWVAFQIKHGLDDDRLASLLYSRLVVDRYVQRNVVAGASGAEAEERYRTWITVQRTRTAIRRVAPIPATDGAP